MTPTVDGAVPPAAPFEGLDHDAAQGPRKNDLAVILEPPNGAGQGTAVEGRAARDSERQFPAAASLAGRGALGTGIEGLAAEPAQWGLNHLDLCPALAAERVATQPAAGFAAGWIEQIEDAAEEGVHRSGRGARITPASVRYPVSAAAVG